MEREFPFSPLGFTDLVNKRQALKLPQNLDALSAGLPQEAPPQPMNAPDGFDRYMKDLMWRYTSQAPIQPIELPMGQQQHPSENYWQRLMPLFEQAHRQQRGQYR